MELFKLLGVKEFLQLSTRTIVNELSMCKFSRYIFGPLHNHENKIMIMLYLTIYHVCTSERQKMINTVQGELVVVADSH